MIGSQRTNESKLQRVNVTCKTCGLSESFYSNLSLERFKLKHVGHEIDDGSTKGQGSFERGEAQSMLHEEASVEGNGGANVSKVLVDLVTFPAFAEPMFRIRGFKDGPEEAFVLTSPSHASAKVREFLERGQYVDYSLSNTRYSWEKEAVEYEADARERLHLPAESANRAKKAESGPVPQRDSRGSDPTTVAATNKILLDDVRSPEVSQVIGESRPVSSPVESILPEPHGLPEPQESPTVVSPQPRVQERIQEQPFAHVRAKAVPPRPPPPAKAKEKLVVEKALEEPSTHPGKEESEDYLLVSKSWYVQGGTKNKKEAARISKVLKAFRWKVEPVYTIGVILDDMLSIETNKNQMSRTLIQSIEGAGYRLTAVTTDQGKLAAWFKKSAFEMPSSPDSADSSGPRTRIAGLSKSVEEGAEMVEEQSDASGQPFLPPPHLRDEISPSEAADSGREGSQADRELDVTG